MVEALALGEIVCYEDQVESAKDCCVEGELDKEFERCFADYTADPGAEVVHLSDAAIDFAAVVISIQLPREAVAAEWGAAIVLADEDISSPELIFSVALFMAFDGVLRFFLFDVV